MYHRSKVHTRIISYNPDTCYSAQYVRKRTRMQLQSGLLLAINVHHGIRLPGESTNTFTGTLCDYVYIANEVRHYRDSARMECQCTLLCHQSRVVR